LSAPPAEWRIRAGGGTMAGMTLTLVLLACVDPAAEGDPALEPTLTVDAASGTLATVTWTTETPVPGHLEVGADTGYGTSLPATDSEDGLTHTVRWFGTPAGAARHWRAVPEGEGYAASTDAVYEAPSPPVGLPTIEGESTESATSGYLLTAVFPNPTTALILGPDNVPVWWHAVADDRVIMQARLSADGQAVWLLDTPDDYLEDTTVLRRVPLAGGEETVLPLPQGHHDFRELDDGRIAYLAWSTQDVNGASVIGDALQAIDEAGATEALWSSWGTVPTDTIEPKLLEPGNVVDWTHCNGFDADATDGTWWVSAHNLSAILVVDPAIHGVRWQIGGARSNVTVEGGGFDQQHGPTLVPGGFLVFDNGPEGEATAPSEVVEYTFDAAGPTATRAWAYEDPDGLFATILGNTERLPGGDTLVGWGAAGRLAEVTPAGERVRRVDVGLGAAFAFVHALGPAFIIE
jgi:hypothetical protein